MSPRELERIVRDMAGRTAEAVDQALRERELDACDKIAVKIELSAMAQQRTLSAKLATDDAEWHPGEQPMRPLSEVERLMRKAGLQPGKQYSETEITEACRLAGIEDPTEKLAIKLEAEQRGMLQPRQTAEDGRRLHASADTRPRGKLLVDKHGNPRRLRFV